jgi:copper chaperone NosL
MFSLYLQPEQKKHVRALYVQDMASTAWDSPKGAWIDAKTAFYVLGSRLKGSMGPTLASFAQEQAAKDFAARNGGTVLAFAAVKPDMVVLNGGSVNDQRM